MLETLQKEWWQKDGVVFDAKKQHHRCIAHIINIGVTAAMDTLKMPLEELEGNDQHHDLQLSHDDEEEDDDDDFAPPKLLEGADVRNIIEKV